VGGLFTLWGHAVCAMCMGAPRASGCEDDAVRG
jgi:hypothetical protein